MQDRTTTLSALVASATEAGDWADQFDCVVKRGEPPQGNKPSKASVYDPANGAEGRLVWFGGDLRDYEGKTVRVGGKGNKAKNYRGTVEISIGKNGTLAIIGAAPAAPANEKPNAAGNENKPANTPTTARAKVDPTTYFHREMRGISLLYMHAYQYAMDVAEKLSAGVAEDRMSEERFQALTSSLFITAKDRGLLEKPPALRVPNKDEKISAVYAPYVPPAPDPAAVEAERVRKAAEAEAQRKAQEAEEAAKKAREAAAHNQNHPQENVDEDVPF